MQADERFAAFHLLSTLIAVVDRDCRVQFVNAAFEDASGSPYTWWMGKDLSQRFAQAPQIQQAVQHASAADYDTLRFDALMLTALGAEVSVHAIVSQAHRPDCVVVELLPMATQARQARVEQQAQQSQQTQQAQQSQQAQRARAVQNASSAERNDSAARAQAAAESRPTVNANGQTVGTRVNTTA